MVSPVHWPILALKSPQMIVFSVLGIWESTLRHCSNVQFGGRYVQTSVRWPTVASSRCWQFEGIRFTVYGNEGLIKRLMPAESRILLLMFGIAWQWCCIQVVGRSGLLAECHVSVIKRRSIVWQWERRSSIALAVSPRALNKPMLVFIIQGRLSLPCHLRTGIRVLHLSW